MTKPISEPRPLNVSGLSVYKVYTVAEVTVPRDVYSHIAKYFPVRMPDQIVTEPVYHIATRHRVSHYLVVPTELIPTVNTLFSRGVDEIRFYVYTED